MDVLIQQACLADIRRLWSITTESLRPPSVWIAEHEAIPEDADWPRTPVASAWVLDDHGLAKREAIDYVRFITIHEGTYWHSGIGAPPRGAVFNSRRGFGHEIGLASFVPILGGELIYLSYMWGGTFGRADTHRFDSRTGLLEGEKNLWIS